MSRCFGIAVETGVVTGARCIFTNRSKAHSPSDHPLTEADIPGPGAIEGVYHRLRPKLLTFSAVLASLIPFHVEWMAPT